MSDHDQMISRLAATALLILLGAVIVIVVVRVVL